MNLVTPTFGNKFFKGVLPYIVFFLVALGFANAARFHFTSLPTGDEVHILVASWSLAKDGDFDLRNQYDSDFLPLRLPDRAIIEIDGKQYPQLSLFDSVIFWAPAKLAISFNGGINEFLKFVKIQMNLLWCLVATLLFFSLCKNKFNTLFAFISSIGLIAFFPGILYASSASADSLGGVIFTLCLIASLTMNPSKVFLNVTLGLLSGLLVVIHPRFFPIALVILPLSIASTSLITKNPKTTLLLFLIAFSLPISVQILLNYLVYPDPSALMALFGPTGPHFKKIISLETGITSLPFTLFDGWHGLFSVAPFAIPAIIGLFRDNKNILISKVILFLICAYLVIIGTNPDARGNGFYLGGRYFIVFIGCIWWGFALYLQQLFNEWETNKSGIGNKKEFIIPIIALLILSGLVAVSTYYSYRSDGFSAAGKSYGDYSSIFPLFLQIQILNITT